MFHSLKKIFGSSQERLIRKYRKIVNQVNAWDNQFNDYSDEELKAKTQEFKDRFAKNESLDQILPEAYAVVKNTCRRLCGREVHVSGYTQKWDMVPYDVQILGGIAMHFGAIAEMQTGEGKTLTASMPLYLNAISSKGVHLVTVNDYLAERDAAWIGEIFRWLGLSVGVLTNQTPPHLRKEIYHKDIVYGTSSEFGFDYLRDNSMAQSKDEQCQREHFFAIVDEIDSILIDEARTPLIISGPSPHSRQMYDELKEEVARIVRLQRDFCYKLAGEARNHLQQLGVLEETDTFPKLNKQKQKIYDEALRNLWLVSKGTPQNNVLHKIKEIPDLRADLEKWDIYYHAEPNKEERIEALAKLYIIIDEKANEFELTDKGIQSWDQSHAQDFIMLDLGYEYAQIDSLLDLSEQEKITRKVALREEDGLRKERAHNLRQLFRAHLLMEKDVDYIVQEDKIVIIDENTGRPQPGRRFSDGLHQAIEAKEGLTIQAETQTYATITLQNYFRLYDKLAGMTGTAMTEANEFKEIYQLEVLSIPTHRPCIRKDENDEIYMTEREKYNAIVKEVQKIHAQERPILIGTESVDVSEKLARILKQNKLQACVLNAKNHEKEAEIIAKAGEKGAITVATNMAGRGTDIKLANGVASLGGLHVIGTTRHQSRRIDRQLRGRCSRLGDPGSSKFFISFEDSLMRLFASPRITLFLKKFRPPEGEPISAKMLNKSIETAQKRVEQRNYSIRKHTLEYDDVMNKQRSEIYAFRHEILHTEKTFDLAKEIIESLCLQAASEYIGQPETNRSLKVKSYCDWLKTNFPVNFDEKEFDNDYATVEEIETKAAHRVVEALETKILFDIQLIEEAQVEASLPALNSAESIIENVIRNILIRSVDSLWQEHLLHIDHLRTEVSLRSVAQKDPLVEFKHEAFALFDSLSFKIKEEIAHRIFKFQMIKPSKNILDQKKKQPKLKPKVSLSFNLDEEV
ncbi:MAG: preprotein translocase subunit SecA [Rhabdochlamydiaceae bacterium]